jgi:thioredoxin 1
MRNGRHTKTMERVEQPAMEGAVDLSEEEFNHFVVTHNAAVVVCWVDWCKHSRRLLPVVDETAREMAGKVAFGKVNAQQNTHFPVRFRVKATPTSLVFREGVLVGSVVGDMEKEELLKRIDAFLSEA